MTHTALPEQNESLEILDSGERNHDLRENLSPQERDDVRKEAVRVLHDDRKIWHGVDYTGAYKNARYNRRTYAEAGAKDEVVVAAVKACHRGFWGERLSSAVPLENARTVFVSRYVAPGELQNNKITDVFNGEVRPESSYPRLTDEEQLNVVKDAVQFIENTDPSKKSEDLDAYVEYVGQYTAKYGKRTVEPDGLLANMKSGKYTGVVEVKTYTVAEVAALVAGLKANAVKHGDVSTIVATQTDAEMSGPIKRMVLGADLEAEFQYLESVAIGNKDNTVGEHLDTIAVLRFPEDIPDDLLKELGQLMEDAHYKIAIQKIPFTNADINTLAKIKISKSLPLIKGNLLIPDKTAKFFTPRDIRIYTELASDTVEW